MEIQSETILSFWEKLQLIFIFSIENNQMNNFSYYFGYLVLLFTIAILANFTSNNKLRGYLISAFAANLMVAFFCLHCFLQVPNWKSSYIYSKIYIENYHDKIDEHVQNNIIELNHCLNQFEESISTKNNIEIDYFNFLIQSKCINFKE